MTVAGHLCTSPAGEYEDGPNSRVRRSRMAREDNMNS